MKKKKYNNITRTKYLDLPTEKWKDLGQKKNTQTKKPVQISRYLEYRVC